MDRRLKEVGSLSYISTDTFNNNFYNYLITSSPPTYVKVGSLVGIPGATSLNCPAGNVLRENGKKLYPGVHSGVTTYMVGVFDILSGFKGYINPNDPMFAPYNSERPLYQLDSVYTGDGRTKNLGPSVLTLGHLASSGDILTSGQVYSSTVTDLTPQWPGTGANPILLDMSLGQIFNLNLAGTTAAYIDAKNLVTGGIVRLFIYGVTNANTRSLTFGANTSPLMIAASSNTLTVANRDCYVLTFVCNGNRLWETSRSSALLAR